MEMVILRLLWNTFRGSVRVRVSQKQSVVEWGGEALLFLLDCLFFFFNILSGNFYINILQKVGRLVSSVPFSHPSGQQRWSYLKMKPVLGFFQQIFVAVVLGGGLCKEPWVDNGEVRKRNTKLPSCAPEALPIGTRIYNQESRLKLCLPLTLSCVGKGRPLSSRMRDFPLFIDTEALSYIHSFHQPWIVSSPGRSTLNISDEKAA